MNISISSFVYLNYPLHEAIKRIAEFGYQGVEIWGGRPHAYRQDLSGREIEALKGLIEEEGLDVSGFIPAQFGYPTNLCIANEQVRQDSIAYLQEEIRVAATFGAPLVSLCPGHRVYGQSKEDGWERLKDSIRTLSASAVQQGVRLAIEPADRYETDVVQTTDDVLRLLQELELENVGVVLDTGHAYVVGEELSQVVRELGEVLFHIHIDDNHGQRDEHLIPGDGEIDFLPFLEALEGVGYSGYLVAELGFGYTIDPDQAVQDTMERLRGLIGKAGGRSDRVHTSTH